ncbi:MAG: sn-glycerol-3-phosphate ABC transporter ATP-binding protein UgpC [Rubrimonas sp.]|uniref:sn-glycerol-3-phosphate ABC transporter ATP-binding protein UgpC n=1 Tax=Rubrimonas sp. TaxID=2036015 RepID=UPI002FDDF672
MTSTLEIVRAVKRYPNGHLAVKGVDIAVGEGEFAVFVGPSGCGKSTLLRMVAGLEKATEGEIRLSGRVVNDVEPADRDIAMVFQNYALYPHMSVYDNLAYGLRNRRTPRAEIDARVREAAALLQIGEYLPRKPAQLSGGQRQRVAMGRAIVRHPAIFLFDEPLSNLDAKLRTQMRLEIRRLQRRIGVAAVYVTHDQVEAMTLADRIVVLNEGRVEQIGAPKEVYDRPASTFVASFIGAPAMNLFPATVEGGAAHVEGGAAPLTRNGVAGPATVGLRPEKARLGRAGEGLPFRIDTVEELGATRLAHGRLGAADFVVSLDAAYEIPADAASVTADPEDLHLFHPETGARL